MACHGKYGRKIVKKDRSHRLVRPISASAVCGFTCFDSVEDREAFLLCEDMLAFGGFTRAIRWDFDHAWDRAVWFISFCG